MHHDERLIAPVPQTGVSFLNFKIMAQQKGILPLKGTMGNITFYKSKDGYLAREKGGIDSKRFATDPAFQRTRENGQEFGRAGKAGKFLRNAVRSLLQNTSDSKMVSRLTAQMIQVIKEDRVNPRGLRNIIDGEAELLEGFEFNVNGKLNATFFAPFTPAIDRVTGALTIDIPAFIPAHMVAAPGGTTHFRINTAGVEIDFEKGKSIAEISSSDELALDNVNTAPLSHSHSITPNSTHPLFIFLGIEFLQEVNGSMYPLKNGAFNALAIVNVSGSTI
jgi:hypothetical protein